MSYKFPNIHKACPLCGKAGCVRWKGYYIRTMFCTELKYTGRIAIRVGECRGQNIDFSMFPSFLLPSRRVSKTTLSDFIISGKKMRNFKKAVDVISEKTPDPDKPVPTSTGYSWVYAICAVLRLNKDSLRCEGPVERSVNEIYKISGQILEDFFSIALARWHPQQNVMIFHPP